MLSHELEALSADDRKALAREAWEVRDYAQVRQIADMLNRDGKGEAVGSEDMALSAALEDEGGVVHHVGSDGVVYGRLYSRIVVVMDVNGPWAITID